MLLTTTGERISFPPYQLDLSAGRLSCGPKPLDLPPKAFGVLRYLAERPGQLVSKEELLQEIVRQALGQDIATAYTVKRSRASTKDKIAALIEAMVKGYDANYPHMHVYIEDLGRISRQDNEWSTDVIARTREYESIVHSILAKGQRDGTLRKDLPVELCAMALFGMVNWMHRWYRPNVKWSPEEVARTFTAFFLDGFENK